MSRESLRIKMRRPIFARAAIVLAIGFALFIGQNCGTKGGVSAVLTQPQENVSRDGRSEAVGEVDDGNGGSYSGGPPPPPLANCHTEGNGPEGHRYYIWIQEASSGHANAGLFAQPIEARPALASLTITANFSVENETLHFTSGIFDLTLSRSFEAPRLKGTLFLHAAGGARLPVSCDN